MKKLTLIAFAIFGSFCGYSQEQVNYPKNQIAIAYGAASPYVLLLLFYHLPEGDFFSYYSGIFSVQYMRTINKKVELGVLINHERWGENNTYWPNDELWRFLSVMQFNCFNKEKIRLYAKWGLGVSYFRCPDYIPEGGSLGEFGGDYWVLPCLDGKFGAELGPSFLRLFSEVGFGAQGIASIGIRSRF